MAPEASATRAIPWALLEGLCWGAALWIKPHVVFPALLCWLVSAVLLSRGVVHGWRRAVLDGAGLLAGGLVAGGLGILWLWQSGAWPAFLDIFLGWNREYVPTEALLVRVLVLPFLRFFPWGLVHVVAVPLAVVLIGRGLALSAKALSAAERSRRMRQALLAALYLGWLLQSVVLQHVFDYIHVPAVLLALTLLVGGDWPDAKILWVPVAAYLGVAASLHPLVKPNRLALWLRCWREGSTAAIKDRLALTPVANWTGLERVAQYLREQGVKDGEVTCYDLRTTSLYLDLDLKPSTRFPFLDMAIFVFPRHEEEIRRALAGSRQRLVVTDLPPQFQPASKDCFPWNEDIIYRIGRYAVHRVTKPVQKLR
jgi:hypothetical protein